MRIRHNPHIQQIQRNQQVAGLSKATQFRVLSILVVLLLLATWFGARGLNTYTLWYDEWRTIFNSAGGPYPGTVADILVRVHDSAAWPPGYFLMLAGWDRVVGSSLPVTGRILSLFAGLLAIAWTYRLGRDMHSAAAGLCAAAVLATSAFFIYYMDELRAYTLYAMFTAMSVDLYWRLISNPRRPALITQGLFVFSVAGLAYTHYAAAFTAVAMGGYHVLFAPKTGRWWRIVVLLGLAFILFIPWVVVNKILPEPRSLVANGLGTLEALDVAANAFSNNATLLLAAIVGIVLLRARGKGLRFLWFWAVVLVVLVVIVNTIVISFLPSPRQLMFFWPLFAVIVGVGIDTLSGLNPRWRLPWLVLGVWMGIGVLVTFNTATFIQTIAGMPLRLPANEFSADLTLLNRCVQPGDKIVFHVDQPEWEFLYGTPLMYYTQTAQSPFEIDLLYPDFQTLDAPESVPQTIQQMIGSANRVWFVLNPQIGEDTRTDALQSLLSASYRCVGQVNGSVLPLKLFSSSKDAPGACAPDNPPLPAQILAPCNVPLQAHAGG